MQKETWVRSYAAYYPTNGYSKPPWEIYDQFLKIIESPGAILELGSGNGLLLRYLHDLSPHRLFPFGMDVNGAAIEEARTVIFPDRRACFAQADLREEIPFAEPFSTVLVNPLHADRGYSEQVEGKIQKLYLDGTIEALVGRCWRALGAGGQLTLWCYDGHVAEIAPYLEAFRSTLASTGRSFREVESGPVSFWLSERKGG